jgi:predicted short-subunit dehydrogenase-like oxidoreductase (DUF2520 family)
VVGCGRVGITWARHLAAVGGVPVGFVSRRRSSARAAAAAAGGGQAFEDLGAALREANLILITTPDGQIEATGRELAATRALKSGSTVLHCSGALDADTLAAVREGGAHAGSLHPLQSFAAPVLERNPFQGIVMAGEGDAPAVALGEDLAVRLEARFIRLPPGTKTLYHAAAVTASNYLVALLGGALEMLSACELDARDAFEVLAPLVRGTLANIDRMGIPEALTGPIARGDAATVERHCRDLAAQRPALLRLYRVLGEYTLAVAQARGELDARQIEALQALLTDVPGR